MRHSEAMRWSTSQILEPMIAAKDEYVKAEGDKSRYPGNDKEYPVGIVTEDNAKIDDVNATKRDSEINALLMQPKRERKAGKKLANYQLGPIIYITKGLPSQKRIKRKSRKSS